MAKDWTPNQRRFIEWLATPDNDRMPLTQRALAEQMGIHEVTLSNWHKLPGLHDAVNTLVDEHLGDDYPQIVDALKREARKGSYQHQKLYLELVGKYVLKVAPTTPDGKEQYTGVDDDDTLIAKAAAIIARGTANAPEADT